MPWLVLRLCLPLAFGLPEVVTAELRNGVVLTNIADIHRLSREKADLGFPVRLKGVVTYTDRQWNLLFIQDASEGVFVSLAEGPYPTNTEFVAVEGRTGDGSFLPIVMGATWRHLGEAREPEPRRISQPERFAAEIDCAWSELIGIVRRVTLNNEKNHFQIDVADGGWRARVFVPAPNGTDPVGLSQMIDARVSILAVAGVDYDDHGGISLKAFAPSSSCIRVLDSPQADPFLSPYVPLSKVLGFSATNTPANRIHIRGVATYLNPAGELVLQEEKSALRVQVPDTRDFKVGDSLQATGFLASGLFTPVLQDAAIRPANQNLHVEPASAAPATVLWGNYDARLVRLTGILQNQEITETNQILKLLQDGVLFGVSLNSATNSDWLKLQRGDRIQVTGVCAVQGEQRGAPQSFQVLLRSASDAVQVSQAREFSARQMLTILGLAAAAGGVILLWGMVLRRRVREQTTELATSLSLLTATIESTSDGILVVDRNGRVMSYNTNFAKMWGLPREVMDSKEDRKLVDFAVAQLKDRDAFLSKVQEVYANPEVESIDTLEFQDGKVFERYSQPQRLEGKCVGRVWSFRDVTARKRAEAESEQLHQELLESSRRIGMAEVATAVLHNVGNVLNSVNVSATLVNDRLRRSRASNLAQAAELIEARMNDLEVFLSQDPKGQKLRGYLRELSHTLIRENDEVRKELESLRRNIEHIKTIVSMQQSYARVSGTLEKLDPKELMENAVQINGAAYERDRIQVVREYQAVPQVMVERHKVLQILINLLSNARHALEPTPQDRRRVMLSVFTKGSERVCLQVRDNGSGIEPANLGRIFNQGFTTRKDGHGFGLHSGANAAKEMKGALSVQSEGPGKGATFTLELSLSNEAPVAE